MRRTLLFGILIAAASCGRSDSTSPSNSTGNLPTPPASTAAVTISGLQFNPSAITVSPGTTVTWTNNDNTAHTVTFSSSSITSIGDFSSGSRTATMPTQAGTYAYHCTIHPFMTGSVTVQ